MAETAPVPTGNPEDKYDMGELLGEGTFGLVYKATPKDDPKKTVAVKAINKSQVKDKQSLENERVVLQAIQHDNIVNLLDCFQNEMNLYFVLEVAEGGELFKYTQRYGLEEMPKLAPHFIAEIIKALEFMHSKGILHRDVKPENMLLTADYHVKICDFGTAIFEVNKEHNTFTGTAEYMAPELLEGEFCATKATDLWAVGCLLFQLFVGRPPFQAPTQFGLFQAIAQAEVEFPPYFPADAKDLVLKLLSVEPAGRPGCTGDYTDLKNHPFFAALDWDNLDKKSNVTVQNKNHTKEWQTFLLDNERVIFSSEVKKSRRLSRKKRQLVLTDYPRLFYIDPDTKEVKGQIPWKDMWAEQKSDKEFIVHCPGRDYEFKCKLPGESKPAELWARNINSMLKRG